MSDFFTTKIFLDNQLGVNGHDLNQITSGMAPNPDFITNKTLANQPSANGSDQILLCQGGTTLVRTPYSGFFLPAYVRPAAGLPQYVSTINGDMSVWQPGVSFPNVASGTLTADMYKPTTTLATGQANITQLNLLGSLVGTANNYRPRSGYRVTVATSQSSLGAGEYFAITQKIERSQARKLFDQPSSNQVWVRSSVAGTFSFGLRNADQSQTYKADFSVGTPNVWQRLTMPNIATMPDASGDWGTAETDLSYVIGITLGCGSTFQSATQNAWVAGNFLGSASQTNLFATGAATFDICLLQHESGTVCTPFAPDKSFSDTLLRCKRYFQKTYPYGSYAGTANLSGSAILTCDTTAVARGTWQLNPSMRITPTWSVYNASTGAGPGSTVWDLTSSASIGSVAAVGAPLASADSAGSVGYTSGGTVGHLLAVHLTADASL